MYVLLQLNSYLIEQLYEQLAGLSVLAAPDDGELVELLRDHARVVERVLQPVTHHHRHGLQPRPDVRLRHLGRVRLKQVRLSRLKVFLT